MHISVVLGTARVSNQSEHVAQAIVTALKAHTNAVSLVPVVEHVSSAVTVPPWGEGGADTVPTEWKAIVEKTDAFVFVLPEYNHSFPGEWKLLMDSLFGEYKGKRAYVAAVGGGQFAGARVMEHVMPVLVNFQFSVGNDRLHIANASKVFDRKGTLTDDATRDRIEKFASAITTG
ncbi:hypothetical protein CL655_01990 [bacterium]|nr:hypothetical protein [bacterium]|tara:strand:+ start:3296 stop:3820 length:525 start_codon:yes stop_codon:yes gene_type:complete